MPKFFCDYCDVYLTHDSMSVRKAHNTGKNHLRNVVDYYQRTNEKILSPPLPISQTPKSSRDTSLTRHALEIGHEKAQSVIDSITSSYAAEGQAHANPMLPHNQPGGGSAFPPPFGFPGGPPPFPGMPGAPPGQFPHGMPPPPGGGRGVPGMPPFPPGPNGLPIPPPGGLPFPPPGGLPFPPPGAGGAPPSFPGMPGVPGMPPAGQGFPPGPVPPSFAPPGAGGAPGAPGQDRR
ncbi:U1 small nuclear ribonucleoprotein C [Conoideocrella luteorostrata]|uniref:U1 small nuclear ribonucleoprotein C n=1 Tax=Conoideocrella luteorostrata TaxID=1105319 RepID=A0AAJ0CI98_9HYPO|nr:U1 small nuclear ribonucleoprotein C [Conoideocrella luteorostrata]